ncbi:unnamed protein product [Cylindrotheca closterium]|uniref:PDZ domain-containing protein n=1 Tax=Cylindrotheca closterium TaxID=2856 RepID=A0AAD2FFV1_9STRA|nr:unnamed protein product [Cylindrotheca closterium]
MVKTTTTTSSTTNNGSTKKKSLFGKIFKKNKSKKTEDVERKVEIVIEQVEEQVIEESRDADGHDDHMIARDPSAAMEEEAANPDQPQEQEEERQEQEEETRDGADIIADLETASMMAHQQQAPSSSNNNSQGWMGGWLENMTNICGPPVDQGLPTILSGEEMDMDMITNEESVSVMSPTSTVVSEAPLSPTIIVTIQEEEEQEEETEEIQKTEEPAKQIKKEGPAPKKVNAKAMSAEVPQEERPVDRPVRMDAPTTPKTPVSSPRKTKLEPEEDLPTPPPPAKEQPKETPKQENDDNTLVVTPEKDDMVQGLAEPIGTKVDLFASLTACCNPMAVPSMDETDMGAVHKEQTPEKEEPKFETNETRKDPDGDKGDDSKSVAQDSQSVVAEEENKEEATTPLVPITPVIETPATEEAAPEEEEDRIVGSIFKEKKNTKMGLSLKNSTMYQGVFIAKIKPGSMFSKTKLREGMQVSEIQGKPCPVALEEAVNMLRHAVGELVIVAHKPKCEI